VINKAIKITTCVFMAGLFCSVLCAGQDREGFIPFPERPSGYVNDLAGIINPQEKTAISSFALELDKKTGAELAVVTIATTRPETIQSFSVRLFDKWKIGKRGKDNGVLMVIAIDDRQAWITTGYGVEGVITDAIAGKIVRDIMAPSFKNGKYSEGILNGSVAVISLIAKDNEVEITGKEDSTYKAVSRETGALEVLLTLLLFVIIFGARSGFLGYFLLGSMVGGRRRGGHWYGTGAGSSGGSFGGFGGFGGGMTGGGGGGGGW
jgi:uncharacterized protein